MRVYPVVYQNQNNVSHRSINKMTKYGIGSLIASSTIFMFSNAVNSTFANNVEDINTCTKVFNSAASLFGIIGTALSITGIKRDENF
jgi:hypothetical protein